MDDAVFVKALAVGTCSMRELFRAELAVGTSREVGVISTLLASLSTREPTRLASASMTTASRSAAIVQLAVEDGLGSRSVLCTKVVTSGMDVGEFGVWRPLVSGLGMRSSASQRWGSF